MTTALSIEEERVQQAADTASRILAGQQDNLAPAWRRLGDALREMTLEAPLHSLLVAFLLGIILARRR